MAVNERLRQALTRKGLTPEQLAGTLEVSPKSIRNWMDGKVPLLRNRYLLAQALGVEVDFLFPDAEHEVGDAITEITAAWARRSDAAPGRWWSLLSDASEEVAILGYAVLHLSEQHPELVDVLLEKATAGCAVRIVLASPSAPATLARDQEEGLDGGLVARIRTSLKYLARLRDSTAQVRLQQAPMYNSIFRFDEEMLVTPHLYGQPGRLAPMFQLRRVGSKGLFERFESHFEQLWADSTPYRGW